MYIQWPGLCGDSKVGAETVLEAAAPKKWSLGFWVILVTLPLTALGATMTKNHTTRALDSVQVKFLAVNAPELVCYAVQGLETLSRKNFESFLSRIKGRLNGVHDGGGLSSFLRLVQFYCEHSLQSRRQAVRIH
nr:uncharacterized protein LOC126529174 isoform X1 [Dermacentor andersoni]